WWDQVKEFARNGGSSTQFHCNNPEDFVRLLKRASDDQRLRAIEELQRTSGKECKPLPQLNSRELPLLESSGISIGNHSHTHPCFPRCSTEKISHEMYRSHEILTEALGHAPKSFAFPNGDSDERAVPLLKTLGYEAAFLFDHRISSWPPEEPLQISRVRVNSTTRMDRFRIILSGLHPAIHRARIAVGM
ncbi:polysaccharide deacetylase family protein, partial [bacterium]|nr:polysaccharide deacetylase family protein [bacterium]